MRILESCTLLFATNNDKEQRMKENIVRTLVVFACGVVMALAAYAGQAGPESELRPQAVSAAAVSPGY